jgi:hypothetical protein
LAKRGSSAAKRANAGTCEEGAITGEGTWSYPNGDIYQGGFRSGKKHGTGTYHCDKGQCQLIGTFDEDAFLSGRWMHSDGSFVLAEFAPGAEKGVHVPKGPATCKFARPGLMQTGEFKEGMVWQGGAITTV